MDAYNTDVHCSTTLFTTSNRKFLKPNTYCLKCDNILQYDNTVKWYNKIVYNQLIIIHTYMYAWMHLCVWTFVTFNLKSKRNAERMKKGAIRKNSAFPIERLYLFGKAIV